MRFMRYSLFLLMAVPLLAQAQQRDTTAVAGAAADDRNVMLDASASAKPRDIPIGLPGETGGTMIMEDGIPVATTWSPIYPYVHWAGGSSYSNIGLMGIEETALRSGVLGFSVDSKMVLSDPENASIAYLPVKRAFHDQVVLAWRREYHSPEADDFAAFLRPPLTNHNNEGE